MQSDLFYGEIFTEKIIDFALFPITKLRFEVLFKKFYPRIHLTSHFLINTHLLNTKNPFSGLENPKLRA
jgi:hypothetical protein